MEVSNNNFGGRVVLIIALVLVFSSGANAKDGQTKKPGFMATLQAQEDTEYQRQIDSIKKMSRAEYQAYLSRRVEKAFAGKSKDLAVIILVDVTAEMNQPEPGFFTKLISTVPDEKNYGKNKVEALLKGSTGKEGKKLTYRSSFKGNGNRHFQQVQGMLDQQAAYLLASQNDITDIHIIDSLDLRNSYLTMHTPTGRVVPRQVQKEYDPKFIDDGLYDELLTMFESQETLMVQVSFPKPAGYENTKAFNDQGVQFIDTFLESWPNYKFEVFDKSDFYVLMITSKEHVESMKKDERVSSISQGRFF